MARMEVEGIAELMLSMKEVAELPDSVAEDMLMAGGEIVAEAQRRHYNSMLRDTGTLAKSIKVSKMKKKRDDARFVTVYPQGKHHTYTDKNGKTKTATNNDVAFVHEFGEPKRGITAKGIMRMSNEETRDKTNAAQYEIYDRFLKSKNL